MAGLNPVSPPEAQPRAADTIARGIVYHPALLQTQIVANSDSILVLGASSWLGHYLVPQLVKQDPHRKLFAAFNEHRPAFSLPSEQIVQISSHSPSQLEKLHAGVIVNLGRGEQEIDFQFHQMLIEYSNASKGRYIYASSSNAVDLDVSKAHHESEEAAAQSVYGKFKARCEQELFKKCNRPLAFRFSAIHGWAPNRTARTEEFLGKLKRGETIPVRLGVIQNRLFVGDLTNFITKLVSTDNAEGVWHLGTSDSSEEISFLRKLASTFGYAPAQVVEDERVDWNLTATMGKFFERFPNLKIPSEDDTIVSVAAQPELAKYRN